MSRKSQPVQQKRKKDKNFVGTITVEQQVVMRRAARRQNAIDNGMVTKSGAGYHNSDVSKLNRKERHKGKLAVKHAGGDHE
jgi:hypothetical protein